MTIHRPEYLYLAVLLYTAALALILKWWSERHDDDR